MRRHIVVAALAAVLASCGSERSSNTTGCNATSAVGTSSVSMAGTAYSPSCIKVTAGSNAVVTFTNDDAGEQHSVTSPDQAPFTFNDVANPGAAPVQERFTTPGTVQIHCTFHPGMAMTVIVQ